MKRHTLLQDLVLEIEMKDNGNYIFHTFADSHEVEISNYSPDMINSTKACDLISRVFLNKETINFTEKIENPLFYNFVKHTTKYQSFTSKGVLSLKLKEIENPGSTAGKSPPKYPFDESTNLFFFTIKQRDSGKTFYLMFRYEDIEHVDAKVLQRIIIADGSDLKAEQLLEQLVEGNLTEKAKELEAHLLDENTEVSLEEKRKAAKAEAIKLLEDISQQKL